MTGVTTTYSVSGHGGLSRDADGVRKAVFHGGGLPGVPISAPVAQGILMSAVWSREGLADERGAVAVREVRLQGFRDRRNSFPGDQETTDTVVSCDLVDHLAEEWCQCPGLTTGFGAGKLRNCLAPQAA